MAKKVLREELLAYLHGDPRAGEILWWPGRAAWDQSHWRFAGRTC